MRFLYNARIWWPALGLSLATAMGMAAQSASVKVVDVTHMCRTCDLRLSKVVRLTDSTSSFGNFFNLARIDRDSRGRYWVADHGTRSNVLVFAADGTLIKRIGREGSGPGEFRTVLSLLVGPGDTVHVFDAGLLRRSVISPAALEVIGQYPMPEVYFTTVMLPNGNFVGASPVADLTGRPFEEVDRKGNRVRSFGGDGKRTPSFTRAWMSRRLAPDGHGGFYAVPDLNYSIEHWDGTGTLTERWERAAPWFPYWEPSRVRPPLHGRSHIIAAWVNADGLLFVAAHVRQQGWEKAIGEVTGEGGRTFQGIVDEDRYYDTIIEVIDPKTSRLLAAIRHDLAFTSGAANGEIYYKGDDPHAFFDIYRVTFVRR